ncbi:fluoride efflux transporter CrcB [Peribacillus sp. SCS-155]|uniref:fluoride efflux transporter CrcB n=1 Tax=Peribacillus sedimenti TaxID=3115297 RepID=UPI003905A231
MILLVGAGGALGAAVRFLLGAAIKKIGRLDFPAGTWIINLTGSAFLGFLSGLYLTGSITQGMWLFAGVGFCGAYTTFSTFGTETVTLIEQKKYMPAMLYIAGSVIFGILFAAAGYVAALKSFPGISVIFNSCSVIY